MEMKVIQNEEVGFDHNQKIGQRILNATNDMYKLDWIGDKVLPKINSKYVSKGKMYRQTAPVLLRHGIILRIREGQPAILNPCGSKEQHFMVKVELDFINSDDTSDYISHSAWGEGADMMDKGVSIATAYAMRTILLNVFLIADGIEPDEIGNYPQLSVPFKPMSKEEQEEVQSALLSKAIPITKKEEEKPAVIPAKTEDKAEEVPKPIEEKTKPKTEPKLSKIMQTAFNNACKEIESLQDRFSTEQYRVLKEAMDNVHDKDSYNSFMNIKKTALDMLVKG